MKGGPGHGNGGQMLGHFLMSGLSHLIALVVLAALVVLLLKLAKGWRPKAYGQGWVAQAPAAAAQATTVDPTDDALKILAERLAKGEIEVDDYYARRTALKGPDPHRPEPTAPDAPVV